MRNWIVAVSVFSAISIGTQSDLVKPIVNPPQKIVGLEAQDTHAAASLLGQFRTSLSSFLFLRADLYLHGGVEMRPLSKSETSAGRTGVGGAKTDTEEIHDDSKIVTVIPAEQDDFRGIFGDVEREVASYRDMKGHHHLSPVQTLPLFRIMTLLDPQFIQGWTTGGRIILWNRKDDNIAKAIGFLSQGLAQNPESIDILSEVSYCYLQPFKGQRRYLEAIPFLEKAKGIGTENWSILSEQEKEALLRCYRSLSVCYRETGKFVEMKSNALKGLELFGNDGSFKIHIDQADKLITGQKIGKVSTVEEKDLDKKAGDHDHDHDHSHGHDHDHKH
jgi:hypothetical protein